MKSLSEVDYIGTELELFKHATNWKKYFSKKLAPYIKGDVLEVGAGIGSNTAFLSERKKGINSWYFLEPDKNLASQIESNTRDLNLPKTTIINGVISDITDEKFDTIIYIDVLEHIEDSVGEIKRIKSLLKPNGNLIILVPAFNFLYNNFDKKIGHFRRYDKEILLTEVNDRLKKERLFYLDSVGFFASVANKFFLKKELPSLGNIKFWDTYLVQLSKLFDHIFLKRFGKSLIGIFQNEL